jgi:magnesium chelatase family protein
MALAQVWGAVLFGMRGELVRVEVDISTGLPSVGIVGLPDAAVGEARWRIRSAFGATGVVWPLTRITVGLSPADLPKRGASLDLAIAIGLMRAQNLVHVDDADHTCFFGELGLDGVVRHVRGAIAAAAAARAAGFHHVVTGTESAQEAAVIPGIRVHAVRDLAHTVAVLQKSTPSVVLTGASRVTRHESGDLADVRGQALARFALEVVAAGGHHLALLGPPGVGKTLLAERLPGILPELCDEDAITVTTHASLAGLLPPGHGLLTRPPFQAPHHSASPTALLGTIRGNQVIPGAVTLAHGGVLFLDEAPEFTRPSLEGLRQPLESGHITIARAGAAEQVPARFQLVLAANPCPCGQGVDQGVHCTCTPMAKRRYRARLSGPLMDRIDARLTLHPPSADTSMQESSSVVASRVQEARNRAAHRFQHNAWQVNAALPTRALRRSFAPSDQGLRMITALEEHMNLRGIDRLLRMAWTIADLRGDQRPCRDHIATALALRGEGGTGVG